MAKITEKALLNEAQNWAEPRLTQVDELMLPQRLVAAGCVSELFVFSQGDGARPKHDSASTAHGRELGVEPTVTGYIFKDGSIWEGGEMLAASQRVFQVSGKTIF